MGRLARIAGLVLLVAIFGAGISYGRFAMVAIPSGVGIAAKHLCSLHFVSGLPVPAAPDEPFAQLADSAVNAVLERSLRTVSCQMLKQAGVRPSCGDVTHLHRHVIPDRFFT